MIEWVPIKDFKNIDGVIYLFLHKHKTRIDKDPLVTSGVYNEKERYIFTDYHMTHVALFNFPVDKTLEEKFEDFFEKHNVSPLEARTSTCLQMLANIAKEHYEAKND